MTPLTSRPASPKTIISIDWDFFVEEDPILDMGHRELPMFLETMWTIREAEWRARGKTVPEMLPFREPSPSLFLNIVGRMGRRSAYPVAVSESHKLITRFVGEISKPGDKFHVVNIDAHHDIAYSDGVDPLNLDCGNWAGYLAQHEKLLSYAQVYPEWRRKHPECEPGDPERTMREISKDLPCSVAHWNDWSRTPFNLVGVFICRSGCWAPPCYDSAFNTLCGLFGSAGLPPRIVDERAVQEMTEAERAVRELASALARESSYADHQA